MKTTHKLQNRVQAVVGMLMVFAVVLGTSSDVFAQVPPASSSIGNQATATYVDNGSNSQSVTSNTVVTTVQQVAGVTITAGETKQVSIGGQVTFSHIITNTGNGSDSFTITAVDAGNGSVNFTNIRIYPDANKDGIADNFTEITSTPNVDRAGLANNSYGVVIVADIPATAQDGQFEDITVTATSAFNTNESATATDKAQVDEDAVILVSKGVSQTTADVGNTLTYTINYSENGNAAATNLVLKDPIPDGLTYVPGTAVWSGTGGFLTDADDGNEGGITFEHITGGTQDTLSAVIANVANGSAGTLSFQVTVDAGQEGETITNTVITTHDDITGDNTVNGTPVTINENYDIEIVDAQDVVINSAQQGATLNFVNRFKNTGSTTDTYNIAVNTGNYPAGTQFFFYKADASNNPTSTYQDTGSDGIPDTGPVAAGDTVVVILQVQLPSGESGGPFSIDKTLTSIGDPAESATHTDRVDLVVAPTVDLTNDAAAGTAGALGEGKGPETNAVKSQTTNPNSTVSFTLYVKNTSAGQDAYNLAFAADTNASGNLLNAGTLPSGWTVTFRDPNAGNSIISQTGNLAAGASKQITAEVFIPAGYQPGVQNIYFRALSSTTNAIDIIHDAVNVNTVQNMQLTSNGSGQVAPGGSRNYIHTLTILSNVTENDSSHSNLEIELTNSKPVGWTSTVYWDTDGNGVISANDSLLTSGATAGKYNLPEEVGNLNFNDQVKFIVKVTGLVGLDDGETNTTTITISDVLTNLASKSNTDLTEVQAGLVVVEKFQAPDVSGTAGTFTKNPFNVLPGDTVYYKITVRNDGSQPVTTISITDDTPSFTTLLVATATNVNSGTVSSVNITSQPTVGGTGTIQVDIDQLDPTEEVQLTFAVKVNN
ncbi:MAG: hypothetical protein ABJH08_02645 [Balneola sp.]